MVPGGLGAEPAARERRLSLFDEIRSAAAAVAARARHVRIDEAGLAAFAERLGAEWAGAAAPEADADPSHHQLASPEATLAYVVTVDAVNFGSGWFPLLRKRQGPDGRPKSGYFTIAEGLRDHFVARGPWSPAELRALDAGECARVFGQDPDDARVAPFVQLLWRALVELGHFLEVRCNDRFEGLVAAAGGRAEALVQRLAEMPLYRDVAVHDGQAVPLFKRAQITAADLALAFEGRGPGAFEDLDELTMFADNLVPHVLRCEGVLVHAPALAARIDAERPLTTGSAEEVEIRAVGLHAVERLCEALGPDAPPPRLLDNLLWSRGQRPEIKARPRHRARSVFY